MAKRKARPRVGAGWIFTWPLMLVFATLVFLAADKMARPVRHVVTVASDLDWEAALPARIDAVTKALEGSALKLPEPEEAPQGSGRLRWIHRSYAVTIGRDEREGAEAELTRLQSVDSGVTLTSEGTVDGVEVRVGVDGLLTHTIRFRWKRNLSTPRVALLVGRLGDDLRAARRLTDLGVPVAFGVLPFRPFSRQIAELARLFDHEVVLDWPEDEPDAGGSSTREVARMAAMLESVPYASAVVVRSRAAAKAVEAQRLAMRSAARHRGLLYLRAASPEAVRTAPARDGKPGFPRVVHVAAVKTADGLQNELEALVAQAERGGPLIVVMDFSPVLLSTLTKAVPEWQMSGVAFMAVSGLNGGH